MMIKSLSVFGGFGTPQCSRKNETVHRRKNKRRRPRRTFRPLGEPLEGRYLLTSFVDALVMYDQTAVAMAGSEEVLEGWIADDIQYVNDTMARSNIDVAIVDVGDMEVNIEVPPGVTNVGELIERGIDVEAVEGFRADHGADILYMYTANTEFSPQYCGASTVPGKTGNTPHQDRAFIVVVNMLCSSREFHVGHETGHLFGAGHQREVMTPEEEADLLQLYAHAFVATIVYQDCTSGVCEEKEYTYGTQVYTSTEGHMTDRALPVYSQPSLASFTLPNGIRAEVPIGTAEYEDNSRMIREKAPDVSQYRSAIVSMDETIDPGTVDVAIELAAGRSMVQGSWTVVSGNLNGLTLTEDGHFTGALANGTTVTVTVSAAEASGSLHEATVSLRATTSRPSPLWNPANPLDVDGGGGVAPLDVLILINYLNSNGTGTGVQAAQVLMGDSSKKLDANGDWVVTPGDGLIIINYLNATADAGGEFAFVGMSVVGQQGIDNDAGFTSLALSEPSDTRMAGGYALPMQSSVDDEDSVDVLTPRGYSWQADLDEVFANFETLGA